MASWSVGPKQVSETDKGYEYDALSVRFDPLPLRLKLDSSAVYMCEIRPIASRWGQSRQRTKRFCLLSPHRRGSRGVNSSELLFTPLAQNLLAIRLGADPQFPAEDVAHGHAEAGLLRDVGDPPGGIGQRPLGRRQPQAADFIKG